jgi:RHS repeat-associated protein
VVSKGGAYTKHIYIGSQRIVSKLGDLDSYGNDPRRIEYAGSNVDGAKVDYKAKYKASQQAIKDNYAAFEVPYYGTDNDDYVNGQSFCCDNKVLKSFDPGKNDNPELYQYYYHSDHLGSSSLITNLDGEIVHHVEYVPFGEVFIEERNNVWNTPYLFNAKELDEETGLYYYGARYYEPRVSQFLSVDKFTEEYPSLSAYNYCANNPIKFIDFRGDSIVTPNMTKAERKSYLRQIKDNSDGSLLFKALYKSLEESKNTFYVEYGKTVDIDSKSGPVRGQFSPSKGGGGTITFSDQSLIIDSPTMSEEFFHAFQFDNKTMMINIEFEAKVFVNASGIEYGGVGQIVGAEEFFNRILSGEFGNPEDKSILPAPIHRSKVFSSSFIHDYKVAANKYARYNKEHNIGNVFYHELTFGSPTNLQQIILKAYPNE